MNEMQEKKIMKMLNDGQAKMRKCPFCKNEPELEVVEKELVIYKQDIKEAEETGTYKGRMCLGIRNVQKSRYQHDYATVVMFRAKCSNSGCIAGHGKMCDTAETAVGLWNGEKPVISNKMSTELIAKLRGIEREKYKRVMEILDGDPDEEASTEGAQ